MQPKQSVDRLGRLLGHIIPVIEAPSMSSPVASLTKMPTLSSHILNTTSGFPAEGIIVRIEKQVGEDWRPLARGVSNADGRVSIAAWGWSESSSSCLSAGTFRATFEVAKYFTSQGIAAYFFPLIVVHFQVTMAEAEAGRHFHIPLLLSPFGYSTYRGS